MFRSYILTDAPRIKPNYLNFGQKRVLRDILSKNIDPQLFVRAKRGFGVPIGRWFKNKLRDFLLCSVINEQTVTLLPCFDDKQLILRDRHISSQEDQTTLLWLCFNYLQWNDLFVALNK